MRRQPLRAFFTLLLTLTAFAAPLARAEMPPQAPPEQRSLPPEQRSVLPQGLASLPAPTQSGPRLALLIGNEAYGTPGLSTLQNPHEDIARVRDALLAAGFPTEDVVVLRDRNRAETIRAINDFSERLRIAGPEAVGFFYYSGHGGSAERGPRRENFIVPVREPIEFADDLESFGVSLVPQVDKLTASGAGAVFVVIDACRNTLSWKNTMAGSVTKGLRREDFNPTGMMLLFSAGDGAFADDDPVFSTVLADEVRRPGQSALEAFAAVSRRVGEAKGFGNKTPVVIPALTKELCFVSCALDLDERDYATAREINTQAAWDFYLRNHPQGRYVAEARAAREASATSASGATRPAIRLTPPQELFDSRRQPASVRAAVNSAPSTRLTDFSMFRECEDCPDMVVIPGGSFVMGSLAGEADRDADEDDTAGNGGRPVPMTIAGPLAIGRFEITKGQYRDFTEATGREHRASCQRDSDGQGTEGGRQREVPADWTAVGFPQAEDHPVVCISWEDAQDYVAWTNDRLGLTGQPDRYRLLSEAEFEYANRAGTRAAYPWGSGDGEAGCVLANYADATAKAAFPFWPTASCSDDYVYTAPVGRFTASPFGLYDMAGNVREWVEDCYEPTLSGRSRDGAAVTSDTCGERVHRGSSWVNEPRNLRSANRSRANPDTLINGLGFRLARTLAE